MSIACTSDRFFVNNFSFCSTNSTLVSFWLFLIEFAAVDPSNVSKTLIDFADWVVLIPLPKPYKLYIGGDHEKEQGDKTPYLEPLFPGRNYHWAIYCSPITDWWCGFSTQAFSGLCEFSKLSIYYFLIVIFYSNTHHLKKREGEGG